MAANEVAPSNGSKSISIEKASPMRLRRVTWATESQAARVAWLALGMSARERLGKTFSKQEMSRSDWASGMGELVGGRGLEPRTSCL
jgi:hypothetical protein